MTRHATEATRLVDTSIIPKLARTVRLLERWTGGYPSSTEGAPAPSGRTPDVDGDESPLTKLETDATSPDFAHHALVTIEYVLVQLCTHAEAAGLSMDSTLLRSRLVALAWLTAPERLDGLDATTQRRIHRHCERLDQIIRDAEPVDVDRRPDTCHAHAKAGEPHEPIDDRFRRYELCRWCGEFRAMHGTYPPADLVRIHDRGRNVTASDLARHGIRRGA